MTHLLIAYDGSPSAATAVRAAAGLFPDAQTSIATVPPDPAPRVAAALSMHLHVSPTAVTEQVDALNAVARREADESTLQAVEQARALGLDAEPVTIPPSGPAWITLLDFAHRLAADVLVCGSRGRGAFARTLLGSTSTSLLHQTDVPLLVVPDGGGTLDGPIVLAYDGSEGAKTAIGVVGRVLRGHRAVIVHAWEPMFHRSLAANAFAAGAVDGLGETVVDLHRALVDGATATTQDGVAIARAAGMDAVGDTVEADHGAWRAVAAAARAHNASAIAMGTRGLGAARSVLLGSVSSGLVQNTELPVLVVPEQSPP